MEAKTDFSGLWFFKVSQRKNESVLSVCFRLTQSFYIRLCAFSFTLESKATERNAKTSVASQISNLKTKVGSPTQIINRISNPIRTTLHRHRGGDLDVNALAEVSKFNLICLP